MTFDESISVLHYHVVVDFTSTPFDAHSMLLRHVFRADCFMSPDNATVLCKIYRSNSFSRDQCVEYLFDFVLTQEKYFNWLQAYSCALGITQRAISVATEVEF